MKKQTHKYYDGIPQWIRNLSKEDLDKLIEEEEKRLAELNNQTKKGVTQKRTVKPSFSKF